MLLALLAPIAASATPCTEVPAGVCATAALHRRCPVAERIPLPAPPPDHKPEREAGPGLDNQLLSHNFALKWGNNPPVGFGTDDAQQLLDALELAWTVQVDELGYPAPDGADAYRFNVYLGDSGGNSPSSLGNSGYFFYDDDGWPMVVLGPSAASDVGGQGRITAAHEFFHAVQAAVGTYSYDGPGDWWHEATAVWMESQVFPGDPNTPAFLFGFALLPEIPLNSFKYPGSGATEEFHQYGAFVWPTHLAEQHGPDIIYDSWMGGGPSEQPLSVLDDALDGAVRDEFFAFSARNATWDYTQRSDYLAAIERYDWLEPHRPSGTVEDLSWNEPDDHLPQTFGSNYWTVPATDERTRYELRAIDPGEERWYGAVVTFDGVDHQVHEMRMDEAGEGHVDVDPIALGTEAWLVVSVAETYDRDAGLEYSYQVRSRAAPEPIAACSCASEGGQPAWWALGAALWGLRRRRQDSSGSAPG